MTSANLETLKAAADRRVDWLAAGAEQLAAFAESGAGERSTDPQQRILQIPAGCRELPTHALDDRSRRTGGRDDVHRNSPPRSVPRKCRHSGPEPAASKPMLRSCRHSARIGPEWRQLRRTEPNAADQVVE